MKAKRVSNPTNIRFDDTTKTQLQRVAAEYGTTASELVRVAVIQKLPEWRRDGVIRLPRAAVS